MSTPTKRKFFGFTERDVYAEHGCDDIWDIMGARQKNGKYKNNFVPPSWEAFSEGYLRAHEETGISMTEYAEGFASRL